MNNEDKFPGRDRRYPNAFNPCKFTLDRIREEIIIFSKSIPNNSVILDFGCGEKPYYPFFADHADKYIGLDIDDSPERNDKMNLIIKQGDILPFPDEYFDVIISTEVFEHVEDIWLYAREFKRVLKKGGRVLISAPFVWDYHPYPHDFWRISEDGWRAMFRDFSQISFTFDTNSVQTILQAINLLMTRKGIANKLIFRIMNHIIGKFDHNKGDKKIPANIFVTLKK